MAFIAPFMFLSEWYRSLQGILSSLNSSEVEPWTLAPDRQALRSLASGLLCHYVTLP